MQHQLLRHSYVSLKMCGSHKCEVLMSLIKIMLLLRMKLQYDLCLWTCLTSLSTEMCRLTCIMQASTETEKNNLTTTQQLLCMYWRSAICLCRHQFITLCKRYSIKFYGMKICGKNMGYDTCQKQWTSQLSISLYLFVYQYRYCLGSIELKRCNYHKMIKSNDL